MITVNVWISTFCQTSNSAWISAPLSRNNVIEWPCWIHVSATVSLLINNKTRKHYFKIYFFQVYWCFTKVLISTKNHFEMDILKTLLFFYDIFHSPAKIIFLDFYLKMLSDSDDLAPSIIIKILNQRLGR